MQAIQVIGNAALEAPRRRSPLRALIWKEWRQQRWIFFSLPGMAYALLLAALIVWRSHYFAETDTSTPAEVLCVVAAFFGVVTVVILSANAFAGEREENTDQFLAMIPCSRGKLFWVKLGFVLFLILLGLMPLAIAGLGYAARLPNAQYDIFVKDLAPAIPVVAAVALLQAAVPALVASFGGSVIGTILASLPVIAVFGLYLSYSQGFLMGFLRTRLSVTLAAPLLAMLLLFPYVTILRASWRMWVRAERGWRDSLSMAAETIALLIGYVAVPVAMVYLYEIYSHLFGLHNLAAALCAVLILPASFLAAWRLLRGHEGARRRVARTAGAMCLPIACAATVAIAAYCYVTLFAPLSFFAKNRLGQTGIIWGYPSGASPDGRFVTFGTGYGGWGWNAVNAGRAALVEVSSGRTRWLTRFRESFALSSDRYWSASGKLFMLGEPARWLWPLAQLRPPIEAFGPCFLVDAETGQKHSFTALCPGLPADARWPVGWYSEHVFALQGSRDMFFADIEHHTFRQCRMPAGVVGSQLRFFWYWWPITARGILAVSAVKDPESVMSVVSAEGEMNILRYAPDLPEATSMTIHSIAGIYERMWASTDGQWLLVETMRGQTRARSFYLVPLNGAATAALLLSADREEKGLLSPFWQVWGFVPGGHQILLSGNTELGLFAADNHELRQIPVAPGDGGIIAQVELSPSGRLCLIRLGGAELTYAVADLRNGSIGSIREPFQTSWQVVRWLGEDHLLAQNRSGAFLVLNRDGTGAQPLLK